MDRGVSVTGTSYISASEADAINGEFRNALATFTALAPLSLTLYRTGTALTPQTVVMRLRSDRAPKYPAADAAAAQQQDGTFAKEQPFDVAVGDVFTLASGQRGTITTVQPARIGIQKADFTLDEGVA